MDRAEAHELRLVPIKNKFGHVSCTLGRLGGALDSGVAILHGNKVGVYTYNMPTTLVLHRVSVAETEQPCRNSAGRADRKLVSSSRSALANSTLQDEQIHEDAKLTFLIRSTAFCPIS